jgi:uncharacterized surface protein with fasciclin (FAS1) repeats
MKTQYAIAAILFTCLSAIAGERQQVAEFTPEESEKLDWRIVDDGVMGGLSQGKREIGQDGILRFFGTLSLENNGGFSSLRTGPVKLDLSDSEGLMLRVKGDGRTYQVRLSTDAEYRGREMSFQAAFPTEKDKWTKVKVPFARLVGTWRGMDLPDKAFDPAKIRRLGLILADKKEGPFELRVDWIRTYGGAESKPGVVEAAAADGRFGTLAKALGAAGLVETLQGDGPFTVFAPTDKAFAKLPEGTLDELLKPENRAKLQAVLKYHVIAGSVGLADALKAGSAGTLLGEPVNIRFAEGRVRINEATLLEADLGCANGVIHVIDSVILPPEPANDLASVARRAGTFGTLLAAVEAAGFSEALSGDDPITLLAPTDAAFKALPAGTVESLLKPENRGQLRAILALHAIPGKVSAGDALNAAKAKSLGGGELRFGIDGGRLKVNAATILQTDIKADNGVIHVIDSVLLPEVKADAKRKKEQVSLPPAGQIEAAITRGVAVFNSGDHAGCAAIYLDCMKALAGDPSLDAGLRRTLDARARQLGEIEDDTRRAWLLRESLDQVYAAIDGN